MEIICFKDFYRKVFALSIFRRSMMHACYWSVFRDGGEVEDAGPKLQEWNVQISVSDKTLQHGLI